MSELRGHMCRGWRVAAWSLVTVSAVFFSQPLALASPSHPKGEFAQFADCPLSQKADTNCVYSITTGGSFTIGNKTVPLRNPVIVQGGYLGTAAKTKFFGAEGGSTLSRAPQPVPGGLNRATALASWPNWLQEGFSESIDGGMTGVTATLELAARPTSISLNTEHLLFKRGTALGLPAKVKLESPILGGNCYIGSNENPMHIDFTTGKSGAVKGNVTKLSFNKQKTIATITGGRLVSNTFETPAASGCGGIFSYFFDPLVDAILGTPSAAGQNTAILEGKIKAASAKAVIASE